MASRTRASIGSIHFLSRGSSSGRMPTRSSDARITVLTARTRRTWSDTRSRFLAPSLSPFLNASTDGNTVCCMEALSGHSTSKPWWWYLNKKQFNHTLPIGWILSTVKRQIGWQIGTCTGYHGTCKSRMDNLAIRPAVVNLFVTLAFRQR